MALPSPSPIYVDYRSDKTPYIQHLSPARARQSKQTYVVLPADLAFTDPAAHRALAVLLRRRSNFQWSKARLRAATGMSCYQMDKAVKILKEAGHLRIETRTVAVPGKKPLLCGQKWFVSATPAPKAYGLQNEQETLSDKDVFRHREIRDHGERGDNIELESYNLSLTLSETGEGNDLSEPGEQPEVSDEDPGMDSGREDVVTDPSFDIDSPAYEEFNPPPPGDREEAHQWVLKSHFAEIFRSILGDNIRWDRESSRMFYRRFKAGVIRPDHIIVMKEMGRSVVREHMPAAAGSLKILCQKWSRLISAILSEEHSGWEGAYADMKRRHGYYCAIMHDNVERELAQAGLPLPDLRPGSLQVLWPCVDTHPEWVCEQVERIKNTFSGKDIWHVICHSDYVQLSALLAIGAGSRQFQTMVRACILPKMLNNCAFYEDHLVRTALLYIGIEE